MSATETRARRPLYAEIERESRNRRILRIWLGIVILVLFAQVVVGGATRLTNSGLSITQWNPIVGIIPPLSDADWDAEFKLYQQIPQYTHLNSDMTVEGFKSIFWWEWGHRALARFLGVVFGLPLLIFWLSGRIETRLRLPLAGLFVLGGMQGAVGWWMVYSGLSERVDVSQYRLAVHLTLAFIIFASCVWIMRALTPHSDDEAPSSSSSRMAGLIVFMCLIQVFLGALVAGLDAGFTYNTWPLMDGSWIPGDLLVQQPWWINFFENPKTVQFVHRCGAYVLWAFVLMHMIASLRRGAGTTHANRSVVLFLLVCGQAALGIITLLWMVPLHLGLARQGGALIVLGFAVAHLRGFYGQYESSVATSRA